MKRAAAQRVTIAWVVLLFIAPMAVAEVFLSQKEALELAFPECEVERRTVFLTTAQREQVDTRAGRALDSSIVYQYAATCGGEPAGAAYFDTHRVRTAAETLMVVVAAGGQVARVEILRFDEPTQYIPRRAWYDQFVSQSLGPELDRSIRPVTGATLTARATGSAVRRVLALHQVLTEINQLPATDPPAPASGTMGAASTKRHDGKSVE